MIELVPLKAPRQAEPNSLCKSTLEKEVRSILLRGIAEWATEVQNRNMASNFCLN